MWLIVRQRLGDFEGRGTLQSWIGTVAANKAREFLRRRGRLRAVVQAALEVVRYERSLAGAEEEVDLSGPLFDAVRELEDLQRRVVEGKLARPNTTLEEVAAELNLPRHRVKYAWGKAVAALRAKLKEWASKDDRLLLLVAALPAILGQTGGLHG